LYQKGNFQFYFKLGKERKDSGGQARQVEQVGGNSHVLFGQKIPGEKGFVKRCNS
jgi:hypothetical protein